MTQNNNNNKKKKKNNNSNKKKNINITRPAKETLIEDEGISNGIETRMKNELSQKEKTRG